MYSQHIQTIAAQLTWLRTRHRILISVELPETQIYHTHLQRLHSWLSHRSTVNGFLTLLSGTLRLG